MKLSILIPVYNWDVRPLVQSLHGQCLPLGVPFEIRCLDDASQQGWCEVNAELGKMPFVHVGRSEVNLGRAAVRNRLAREAAGEWLLFLDCDVMPAADDFIEKYLGTMGQGQVICGGVAYERTPPAERSHFFRWYYGRKREQQTAAERRRKPWHAFKSANFLIQRRAFLAIGFDERIVRYGHEDTLFGLELERRKITPVHIDNPVIHLGLEPFDDFLRKTQTAVETLFMLRSLGLPVETRLLRTCERMESWRIGWIVEAFERILRPMLLANLRSRRPQLLFFDFYKLALALRAHRRTPTR
ncbi:MAG: glycosyl transferase [Saprospiraceae bacterium]|nr:MAG: glycosyl transferase [Saprospiraceae bacterium]